jgi:zinc transport system permease protein
MSLFLIQIAAVKENSMEFFTALLDPQVPFIRYALITGLVSSIAFGMVGSFVIVKRMSYVAGAVSHTVLGGIGLALYLNTVLRIPWITPMAGALIFALAAGIFISITIIREQERLDTVIGTIWALGMSLGLFFMHVTPGYVDPMSYLFGNILLISRGDLVLILILNLVIITSVVLFFPQFQAVSFDQDFAKTRKLNTWLYQLFLIILISLSVLLLITVVGIVMVIALLTIPAAIAGMYTRRLQAMMVVATGLCALFTTGGLVVSYMMKLPTSSTTVLLAGTVYLIALIQRKVTGN